MIWLKNQELQHFSQISVEKNKLLPDLSLNYFLGTNYYENSRIYHGFEVGLAVPLFFGPQQSKLKASKMALYSFQNHLEYESELLKVKHLKLLNDHYSFKALLDYYDKSGNDLFNEIIRTATISFENGEIDFFKFVNSTETALQIRLDYLDHLFQFTYVTLELNYLTK